MSRLLMLLRGPSGHPLHPPLTDAAIGAYTVAAVLAVVGAAGGVEDAAGKGAWLALLVGLGASVGAAVTGLAELSWIDRRSPTFRTGLLHMCAMLVATVLFALAAIFQYDGFHDGAVTTAGLVLTVVAYIVLVFGGWLGGTIVFVHGQRVMSQPERPTSSAVSPWKRPLREGAPEQRPRRTGDERLQSRSW